MKQDRRPKRGRRTNRQKESITHLLRNLPPLPFTARAPRPLRTRFHILLLPYSAYCSSLLSSSSSATLPLLIPRRRTSQRSGARAAKRLYGEDVRLQVPFCSVGVGRKEVCILRLVRLVYGCR